MRPRRHLVVMARAPRLGAVKRRLARDVGALAAWRVYRLMLAATLRRLAPDPRWTTWLALTPDRAARGGLRLGPVWWRQPPSPFPLPPSVGGEGCVGLAGPASCGGPRLTRSRVRGVDSASRDSTSRGVRRVRIIGQGPGDLGARMGRLLRGLPPGPVVVVGSDIPGLSPARVARAFRALGSHEWVLGPAADGGYWLVGAAPRRRPRAPFANVRWSSRHALKDTLANLKGARVALLEELHDIDTGEDLARYRKKDS